MMEMEVGPAPGEEQTWELERREEQLEWKEDKSARSGKTGKKGESYQHTQVTDGPPAAEGDRTETGTRESASVTHRSI